MAEFSSLNGYAVKDAVARNIAKGRNQAVSYNDYATMIEALNAMNNEEFRTGQNIYIGTVGVPDLWVYSVEPIQHNFTYVSDEQVVSLLENNITVQAGFYKLAMLEGQKVDLTTVNERIDQCLQSVDERFDQCFQSVSDGKTLLASAITDKRVPTDADATFSEMEANIRSIRLGSGNAIASDVRKGKTFTNDDGVEYEGTYDFAKETSATAVAANLTAGFTAWVNGEKITGTRPVPVTKQTGTVTFIVVAATSSGSKTTEWLVSFPSAFENIPTVTASPTSHSSDLFTVTTRSATRTSFYITVVNHRMYGSENVTFSWVAQA